MCVCGGGGGHESRKTSMKGEAETLRGEGGEQRKNNRIPRT